MPARRKKATRVKSSGTPGWMWLATGVLVGLGLAYMLFSKGMIPQPDARTVEQQQADDEGELAPARDSQKGEEKSSRYDFFTVLPEMEVVVPEQELRRQKEQQEQATAPQVADSQAQEASGEERYVLQAGSFRSQQDAEQMKAQLALLGMSTRVQTVTVNGTTWHRVLVGPVTGATRADEVRRQLSANGIESMVTKSQ